MAGNYLPWNGILQYSNQSVLFYVLVIKPRFFWRNFSSSYWWETQNRDYNDCYTEHSCYSCIFSER